MDKTNRILSILYRILMGEKVAPAKLALEYQVSGKSIQRDLNVIRSFFSESRELAGNLELVRENGFYYLNRADLLQPDELLFVIIDIGYFRKDFRGISKISPVQPAFGTDGLWLHRR